MSRTWTYFIHHISEPRQPVQSPLFRHLKNYNASGKILYPKKFLKTLIFAVPPTDSY